MSESVKGLSTDEMQVYKVMKNMLEYCLITQVCTLHTVSLQDLQRLVNLFDLRPQPKSTILLHLNLTMPRVRTKLK